MDITLYVVYVVLGLFTCGLYSGDEYSKRNKISSTVIYIFIFLFWPFSLGVYMSGVIKEQE